MSFRTTSNANVEAIVNSSGYAVESDAEVFSIDEGREFRSYYMVTLLSGAALSMLVVTSGAVASGVSWTRSNPKPSVDSLRVIFTEDPITTANGTALPRICSNRVKKTVPSTLLYHTPTITSNGAELYMSYIPGSLGIGGQRSGGEITSGNKWVLDKNKKYLIRYINESASDCKLWVGWSWRE